MPSRTHQKMLILAATAASCLTLLTLNKIMKRRRRKKTMTMTIINNKKLTGKSTMITTKSQQHPNANFKRIKPIISTTTTTYDELSPASDGGRGNILKKPSRSCWIKPWRIEASANANYTTKNLLLQKREIVTGTNFTEKYYLGITDDVLNDLLLLIEKDIKKKDTLMRVAIKPYDKLIVTLRFLALGEQYSVLEKKTHLSSPSLSKILRETCEAICKQLKSKYVKYPETNLDWDKISVDFWNQYQFPSCLGSLDTRLIPFKQCVSKHDDNKNGTGGQKSKFLTFLALVDANYHFICYDVFNTTTIKNPETTIIDNLSDGFLTKLIQNRNEIKIELEEEVLQLPPVFIANSSKLLRENIMVPYSSSSQNVYNDDDLEDSSSLNDPNDDDDANNIETYSKQIFNDCLAYTRQVSDFTFDLFFNAFKILQSCNNFRMDFVHLIIETCLILHNYLLEHSEEYFESAANSRCCNNGENDDELSQQEKNPLPINDEFFESLLLKTTGVKKEKEKAKRIRNKFARVLVKKEIANV